MGAPLPSSLSATTSTADILRSVTINSVVGQVPDFLFAWVVVKMFETDASFGDILIGFLILKGILLLVWLFRFIFSWSLFFLKSKFTQKLVLVDMLRANNAPKPDDYDVDEPENYFRAMAGNHEQSRDVQVFGSFVTGELTGYRTTGNLTFLFQLILTLKKALRSYKEMIEAKEEES